MLTSVLLLLFAAAGTAHAVIIDSSNGAGNVTAPPNVGDSSWIEDPGWVNVGRVSSLTGVHLGEGWMLTANHVAPSLDGVVVTLDGLLYYPIPGTGIQLENTADGTPTDLKLFRVQDPPVMASVAIRQATVQSGANTIMIGFGRDRGAERKNLCTPFNQRDGWEWGPNKTMRWGTNRVTLVDQLGPSSGGTTVRYFTSLFDRNQPTDHEAIGADGDSGGAVFIKQGASWELAGIIYASASVGNPVVAPLEKPGCLVGAATHAVDLSVYRDQIVEVLDNAIIVAAGQNVTAEALGGAGVSGGVDLAFDDTGGGALLAGYQDVPVSAAASVLPDPASVRFELPGDPLQLWDLSYFGEFTGVASLTFRYEEADLLPGQKEENLSVHRYVPPFGGCAPGIDCGWLRLDRIGLDATANTISVETSGFSLFVLGGGFAPRTSWVVLGTAQGGSIDVTIGAVLLQLVTTPGQTAEQVATAVAAAINADPTLSAAGIGATATSNTVTTGGSFTSSVFHDPGLSLGSASSLGKLPVLSPFFTIAWVALLIVVSFWLDARSRRRHA